MQKKPKLTLRHIFTEESSASDMPCPTQKVLRLSNRLASPFSHLILDHQTLRQDLTFDHMYLIDEPDFENNKITFGDRTSKTAVEDLAGRPAGPLHRRDMDELWTAMNRTQRKN